MKRHPALTPLSREHHQLLVLAQVLKQDVPAYKNMPVTPIEQRDYALERYTELIEPHFAWEEKVLLPLAKRYGDKLLRLSAQVLTEHDAIRKAFEQLAVTPEADLAQELDLLGRALSANVRFEERVLFQKMQELLPETAWISMEQPGRWN
ncbi:hemerythrin domain-containing protein [Lewinella cohaerens]|uniref:hemerythrin domain-containing protein n=1 Tax=Lewinella cohaerens TaxID=70995 RepID=UPI0012EBD189|nr:hemerythrin domain-containing protein [Lewinella cohaerens]